MKRIRECDLKDTQRRHQGRTLSGQRQPWTIDVILVTQQGWFTAGSDRQNSWSPFDPRFEILGAPGLFRDDKHAFMVFTSTAFVHAFLGMVTNKGLTVLPCSSLGLPLRTCALRRIIWPT